MFSFFCSTVIEFIPHWNRKTLKKTFVQKEPFYLLHLVFLLCFEITYFLSAIYKKDISRSLSILVIIFVQWRQNSQRYSTVQDPEVIYAQKS